jgi:hypothetical protein
VASRFQEHGQFFGRTQRQEIAALADLVLRQRRRPGLVVLVREREHALARALDVEPLPANGAFPSDEDVPVGEDKSEGVAQAPARGHIEHRHGRTGPGVRFLQETVDEQVPRVAEVDVGDAIRVVADPEILLEHGDQHEHPEVTFRVAEVGRGAAETVEMPVGLVSDSARPCVQGRQALVDVPPRGSRQPLRAEQVHPGDVDARQLARSQDQQFVQGLDAHWLL